MGHGVRLRKYPLPCIRHKKKKQANQLVLACDVLSHSQRGVFTKFIIRPSKYAKLCHSQNLTSRSNQQSQTIIPAPHKCLSLSYLSDCEQELALWVTYFVQISQDYFGR